MPAGKRGAPPLKAPIDLCPGPDPDTNIQHDIQGICSNFSTAEDSEVDVTDVNYREETGSQKSVQKNIRFYSLPAAYCG